MEVNNKSYIGSVKIVMLKGEKGDKGDNAVADYNALSNHPQINGVTLTGNKTLAQLGLNNATNLTTGTLELARGGTGTDSTQLPMNMVFASPNGSGGNAFFRDLVANDIPDLPASRITSGTIAIARLPIASEVRRGVVKVDNSTIKVDSTGTISATVGSEIASVKSELASVKSEVTSVKSEVTSVKDELEGDLKTDLTHNENVTLNQVHGYGYTDYDSSGFTFFVPYAVTGGSVATVNKLAFYMRGINNGGGGVDVRSGNNGATVTSLDLNTPIWNNGKAVRNNEVVGISCNVIPKMGFEINVTLNYPLRKSGTTTNVGSDLAVHLTVNASLTITE